MSDARQVDRLPATQVTGDFIDQCIDYTAAVSRHGASLDGRDPEKIRWADETRTAAHNALIAQYTILLREAGASAAAEALRQDVPPESRRAVAKLAWTISGEMLTLGQAL